MDPVCLPHLCSHHPNLLTKAVNIPYIAILSYYYASQIPSSPEIMCARMYVGVCVCVPYNCSITC